MTSLFHASVQNTVVVLVGPKGTGKTHIGSLLERSNPHQIHFVRVEAIFMRIQKEEPTADMSHLADLCYQETAAEVASVLSKHQKGVAVLEVTGVAPQLPSLTETLQSRHNVRFVQVKTPLDACLKRVQERDASQQVAVSEERVSHINQLAAAVEYPWALVVDNTSFRSDSELLELFAQVLQ